MKISVQEENENSPRIGLGLRIVKLVPHHIQEKQRDLGFILRQSWIRRIYNGYLKRYDSIRSIIYWVWRNGYPFYVKIAIKLFIRRLPTEERRFFRWRRIVELRQFSHENRLQVFKILDDAIVFTPTPKVNPSRDQNFIVPAHDHYIFPSIYVAAIDNARIFGGSNLVLTGNEAICHDLFCCRLDYTSEELHGRMVVKAKSRRIRWLLYDEEPETVPLAATFIDACAHNYAHWLTEVLPRVAAFCAEELFKHIPIVVDDGLHSNIMASLFTITEPERKIYIAPVGRCVAIHKLYVTSVAGYVPFEWRNKAQKGPSHGLFSSAAFALLRRKLFNGIEGIYSYRGKPEKLFIRRNSPFRKLVNAAEVERVFLSRGYRIIEPEKMTFSQQVAVFSNAERIAGPTGAALANLIFAPEGAKVLVLIAKRSNTAYGYWQNIACASGKKVRYVFGKPVSSINRSIHEDFVIDIDHLIAGIEEEGM